MPEPCVSWQRGNVLFEDAVVLDQSRGGGAVQQRDNTAGQRNHGQ